MDANHSFVFIGVYSRVFAAVLLDECVPIQIKSELVGRQVQTPYCIMYGMISMETYTRRRLLQVMLAAQGAQLASPQGQPFKSLSSSDAAEIEALTAQIIPSTDSPGAREAHVIYFIDQALATFDRHKRDVYGKGLAAVQEKRRELFPGSHSIAALKPDQQISLLGAIEKTPFFETLRTHTVMGFLANPEYGGNRNQTGWKHIGFQSSHHFAPPFGYYDQEENP